MNAFIALVRKDLVLYFSSRRSLLISLAAPIAIAAFFGSLFGGAGSSERAKIPIAVIDLDQSATSKELVTAMRDDATLDVRPSTAAQAADEVHRGKLQAVVTIPARFAQDASNALFSREVKPEIEIQYDPSQVIALQIVQGLLTEHVMQTVMRSVISQSGDGMDSTSSARAGIERSTTLTDDSRRDLVSMFDAIDRVRKRNDVQRPVAPTADGAAPATPAAASAAEPTAAPFRFEPPYRTKQIAAKSDANAQYNAYSHSFAGMGVQFILFMGIDLGIKLLAMRKMGLWQRLRAAPVSRGLLLGSQVVSGALIAAALFTGILAAGILFFHVRVEGSVIGFIGLIVAFALMTAAFGLCIAAVGKTPDATRGIAIFATLVMVMLGGAWVPAFIFPQWLQKISLVIPTRWAVDGFDAVTWRGLSFDAAWLPIVVQLGFALLFALLAVWRFKWDEK